MGNCFVGIINRLFVTRFFSKYEIHEDSGNAPSFLDSHPCTNRKTGEELIVRRYPTRDLTSKELKKLDKECAIRSRMKHDNILKCLGCFYESDYRYLVFEKPQGETLLKGICRRTKYTERNALSYAKQILSAISYYHSHGIVHGDIKPDNIYVRASDDRITVIDYGMDADRPNNERTLWRISGYHVYMAPEILERETHGKSVDVWSCGAVLYNLLGGVHYFILHQASTSSRMFYRVRNEPLRFPNPEFNGISLQARKLVVELMERNRDARITADAALGKYIFTEMVHSSYRHRQFTLDKLRTLQGELNFWLVDTEYHPQFTGSIGLDIRPRVQNEICDNVNDRQERLLPRDPSPETIPVDDIETYDDYIKRCVEID